VFDDKELGEALFSANQLIVLKDPVQNVSI
jgi:hypothetical protein